MLIPDRENVIKTWEDVLSRDPLDAPWDLIDDTLALLKAQEPVVRCKDCKHYSVEDHYGNFHGYEILAASDVPTCHRWGNDAVMVKPDGYCFLGEERVCNET